MLITHLEWVYPADTPKRQAPALLSTVQDLGSVGPEETPISTSWDFRHPGLLGLTQAPQYLNLWVLGV